MTGRDKYDAPHANLGALGRQNLDETARVTSLADVRRARAARFPDGPETNRPGPVGGSMATAGVSTASHAITDLAVIAGEPSFAIRRRKLAEAMAAIGGEMPSERTLDHRMIATGLTAGHGCGAADPDGDPEWPLGSTLDDPAVVVGLVLHHAKHGGARGLPIPASVQHALDRHVAAGSDAARLVRDWWRMRSATAARRHLKVYEGGKP